MKKIFTSLLFFFTSVNLAFAKQEGVTSNDSNGTFTSDNILGLSNEQLRNGNITYYNVPQVIASVINSVIILAGTISVFMLIYYAFQMQLRSGITGDSSGVDRARKGMIASGVGFIISVSAWFLMSRFIMLLAHISA